MLKKQPAPLKSLPVILISITLLFIFTALLFKIRTYDFWMHLAVGRYNLTNGVILKADVFNFSRLGAPWSNHEWLYQICLFITYLLVGFKGIVLLKALLITVVFYLVYKNLKVQTSSQAVYASLLLLLALSGGFWRFSARPHLLSLLFTVTYLYLLQLHAANRLKHPYYLILPQILWVNLHGGTYFLGYFYVSAFLVEAVTRYLSQDKDNAESSLLPVRQLFLCLLILILVSLFNPHSYNLLIFPFKVVKQSFQVSRLDEWQSLSLRLMTLPLFIMPLFVVSALPGLFKDKHWGMTLVTLFLAGLTLRYVRFGPEFLLVAVWPAYHFLKRLHIRSFWLKNIVKAITVVLFITVLSSSIIKLRTNFIPGLGVHWQRYPAKAAKFLKNNFKGWKVINPYNWGGYLMWQLPDNLIFIDGRQLPPGESTFKSFVKMYNYSKVQPSAIKEVSQKFGADLFMYPSFINRDTPLPQIFPRKKWGLIYFDSLCQLYLPRRSKYQDILSRYEYQFVTPANTEISYYQKTLQQTEKVEAIVKELKRAVTDDPQSFAVLPLAQYYTFRKDWQKAEILLQTKLKANPRSANNWLNLGKIYQQMGKIPEAEKHLKKGNDLKRLGR